MSPMADQLNVAELANVGPHLVPTPMEESDGKPYLVINIINIESE